MNLEEAKSIRNAERFPAIDLSEKMTDWLIAEIEKLKADNKRLAAEDVALRDVLDAAVDYVNTVNDEYAERDDKDLAHDELCEAVANYKESK